MPKISIIIPCYYNELNIAHSAAVLLSNEANFPSETEFEYIWVDDGSGDGTLKELLGFRDTNPEKVKVIKLSGNFGSYNAILAGLKHATGDCNVVIAADLQDPVSLMPKMFEHWQRGIKLVVGNRQDRHDPFFSKLLAKSAQSLIRKYALTHLPKGGFDYVLFDKQLKDILLEMNEKNTNTLYLLAWMKFEYVAIPYVREQRKAGKSRWTLSKRIKLFVDSFVAFSFLPIRIITVLGFVLGLCALVYAVFVAWSKISGNIEVEGWTTMMLVFLFVSSFQMIALGILGEYLWRTLDAARNRPNYIVDAIYE
jgi:glycosyltransferase involved in cell wall biosynthesis